MDGTFDADDLARLRIALARIARALDRQTRGAELTRTQASALATIARLGPLRISELAEIEGVNPTMLSRIVGKLEDGGLLRRSQDPDDGRAARVEATAAGAAEAARLRTERTELLARHLASLPPDEAGRLLIALPALESLAHHLKGTT
ncbi:MarR family winged helix-turn-helix transcriptional regulator [Pseudonocardia humida]|uniref:MarR family transcriptional regulator n=1 Tax=Pseudonocardia humida TaxID=2800819 RepID=A0ABT0ZWY4_9PSEU|nr:MarR family transcriptional regulator [Pseudonocardia humida]MCO1655260.1 MarR family transcriptional regulator [Pseudonocardia humida]